MHRFVLRGRRTLLGTALLAAGLLAGALPSHEAQAALGGCRSDPIVFLSNGVKVDLTVAVAVAHRSDIRQITYTLHIPSGASVTRVVYTSGELGRRESLTVVADNAAGSYDADTVVDVSTTGVGVTATMSVLDQTTGLKADDAATGQDHQDLTTHVSQ